MTNLTNGWSPEPADRPPRHATIRAVMNTAGCTHGTHAAAWWQQDNLGGRSSGDRAATASRVLTGLHDIAPRTVDALPHPCLDQAHLQAAYDEHADPHIPGWDDLDPAGQDLARDTYQHAFDSAVHEAVARHCRDLLDPTAESRTTR